MKIQLTLELHELNKLPPDLLSQIYAGMNGTLLQPPPPVQPVQQPQPVQPVQQVPPQPVQPVQQVPPPPVQPVQQPQPVQQKIPQIVGNVKVFSADRGHPTQMDSGVDVMTGQAIPIQAPTTPFIPPVVNAPATVVPVSTAGPLQMQMTPTVDYVRAAAIRLYGDKTIGGKPVLDACLAEAGLPTLAAISEQTAPALYQAVLARGGK
jgi:hypothetical protein